jgi:hypothetical protein
MRINRFKILGRKAGERGNVMLLLALSLPVLFLPIVGLAIDGTICYLVQAKLSAAVDGASLGAGRLLGTLADPEEIANEFLNANFRTGAAGFWGANTMVKTITYTPGTTKTIFVDANVRVPLLFLRVIGKQYAVVSAAATATRRDSRMMLVIDRSGSMSADLADVKNFGAGFVQKFTPGTDQVGLVAYDGAGVVGYPSVRPWVDTTTSLSTGGPDTSFLSNNGASCCDMVYQVNAIRTSSDKAFTNTADGLWLAYIELQKAHMKALAADGVDTRLNSIVLFTDGLPTAVSVDLNRAGANALKATSTCTYRTNTAQKMRGWIATTAPPINTGMSNPDNGYWPRLLPAYAGNTANYWLQSNTSTALDYAAPSPTTPFAGCSNLPGSSSANLTANMNDLDHIPSIDMWGNAMNTTDYLNSEFVNESNAVIANRIYDGTALNLAKVSGTGAMYHWELALWNATYQAAKNIRSDSNLPNRPGDTQNMQIAIYVIGYTGNDGLDQGLCRAIANDKSSATYNTNQATGMYVPATDTTALANAFTTVASAILRLKY